jgi:Asp-tRNA(Asn)/Glu-tRNA(Gln) amidotransferase A subunit family amidase
MCVLERLTGSKAIDVKARLTDGIFAGRRNPVRAGTIAIFHEAFVTHLEALCDPTRTHLYQPSTRTRLLLGKPRLVSDRRYQDAVNTIQNIRRSVGDDLFGSADYLISPTASIEQPAVADCRVSELKELQALRNTRPFNVLGVPTISVPAGFTPDRLPVGLQIAGRPGDDWGVLDLALAFEREAPWFEQRPPL